MMHDAPGRCAGARGQRARGRRRGRPTTAPPSRAPDAWPCVSPHCTRGRGWGGREGAKGGEDSYVGGMGITGEKIKEMNNM
jgi:hypothetical protein